jgi:hypothetical protein
VLNCDFENISAGIICFHLNWVENGKKVSSSGLISKAQKPANITVETKYPFLSKYLNI